MSKTRKPAARKHCPRCCLKGETLNASEFNANRTKYDGLESMCRDCAKDRLHAARDAHREQVDEADRRIIREAAERTARLASDHDALKLEDFDPAGSSDEDYDVGVANVKRDRRLSGAASRHKRQEFNKSMGDNAEALKRASVRSSQGKGSVLENMPADSGAYIGKLAEQERRFGNRRLARTISLAQAQEALALQHMRMVADQFFSNKIAASGYATKAPSKAAKRSTILLLSDLHLGAELSSLDEPLPFRAVEEARRLEFVMRQAIDYKPQYRNNSKLVLLINGDVIEGQLMHQIGAGAPLTEQKAIFWWLFSRMIAEFARAFPEVEIHFQPGNHGRDKVRHPGRATWRKWDGHEWEMYYALAQMCSGLRNVTCHLPFRAVSVVELHGSKLCLTHGDTEIKLGHPDGAAKSNARELDRVNATKTFGHVFDAFAFGHFHTGRFLPGNPSIIFNAALIPPNGHARASGYIGESTGQFLWEAVEGHPIGDVRFLRVDESTDRDERLGKILTPFRFPTD